MEKKSGLNFQGKFKHLNQFIVNYVQFREILAFIQREFQNEDVTPSSHKLKHPKPKKEEAKVKTIPSESKESVAIQPIVLTSSSSNTTSLTVQGTENDNPKTRRNNNSRQRKNNKMLFVKKE